MANVVIDNKEIFYGGANIGRIHKSPQGGYPKVTLFPTFYEKRGLTLEQAYEVGSEAYRK